MNKKIMTITTVMLIVLIFVLIIIYLAYVKNEPTDITTKNNISGETTTVVEPTSTPLISISDISGEGEDNSIIEVSETPEPSPVIVTEKPIKTTKTPSATQNSKVIEPPSVVFEESGETIEKSEPEDNNIVDSFIISDNETSNQDKQQVLTEIDDALQGLLEAVGKVPTVDEEKLNKTLENGEV